MRFILLHLCFFSLALPAKTQTKTQIQNPIARGPSEPVGAAAVTPLTYAAEAMVVERQDVVYQYAADGTGDRVETGVMLMQSDAAVRSFSVLTLPYAGDGERVEILSVRVRKANGSVVETPASDAQDMPAEITREAPFYSDLQAKHVPVRSLGVGDRLEYRVRTVRTKATAPGEFWGQEGFGAGAVVLERTVELRVPKEKYVQVWSPANKPEISESGMERVYTWKGAQLKPTPGKAEEGKVEVEGQAEVEAKAKAPIAWTTFQNWAKVGAWYGGLAASRAEVTPAIQAKADELTAEAKTDTEKVEAIYSYVAARTRYIGVAFGVGRYQPHMAAEVLANQYGDCKDKHTLLTAMLKAKGFEAWPALIGAGIAINEQVPSPIFFNHVITVVNTGGERIWLDTTSEVAPYRALIQPLRNRQALMIPTSGAAELVRTPAELPYPAASRFEAKATLDKSGLLKGHMDVTLRGDDEISMRQVLRQVAPGQWDQVSQYYSGAEGFGGTTSHTEADGPEKTREPLRMHYDYERPDFGDKDNFKIVPLFPLIFLPAGEMKEAPKKELDLGGRRTETAVSTIHLPEGYGADLPDAVHVKTTFASFDKIYRIEGGTLIAERKLEVLQAKLPAGDWQVYRKFHADTLGDGETWIQLTSNERHAGVKGPPAAGENNPVAAELVRQADAAERAGDWSTARAKVDAARSVYEKQAYLWSNYGYLAAHDEQYTEAIADYQKELKLYPNEFNVYGLLAEAQLRSGKKVDAMATMRALLKLEPKNAAAALGLAGMLSSERDMAGAATVLQEAAKASPENKLLQEQMGSALLKSGKRDEGLAAIRAALEGASEPGILNDGAYLLAEEKTDLPLAERSCLQAVQTLEGESAEATVGGANVHSFQHVMALLAAWDTLGWIYYNEGKLALAEEYVRASWRTGTSTVVGEHLGMILEKEEKREEALRVYELAQAGSKWSARAGEVEQVKAAVQRLRAEGVRSSVGDRSIQALQEERTFRVKRPDEMTGWGSFVLQVSAEKTDSVAFTGGEGRMGSTVGLVSAIDLKPELPRGSKAKLLRSGILSCSKQPTCEFVLVPLESAKAN